MAKQNFTPIQGYVNGIVDRTIDYILITEAANRELGPEGKGNAKYALHLTDMASRLSSQITEASRTALRAFSPEEIEAAQKAMHTGEKIFKHLRECRNPDFMGGKSPCKTGKIR